MNTDLGLDAATYGMAAGAFFWGYFLFEVPSNIILEKLGAGAPRWGRIRTSRHLGRCYPEDRDSDTR
jgi:hypothetical protein